MEEFLLWFVKTVGALAVCSGITFAVSKIRFRWKENQIRKDNLDSSAEDPSAELKAELEKLRAENFNYRVAKKIRKKLRERSSLEDETPEQQARRERDERRKRRDERRKSRAKRGLVSRDSDGETHVHYEDE